MCSVICMWHTPLRTDRSSCRACIRVDRCIRNRSDIITRMIILIDTMALTNSRRNSLRTRCRVRCINSVGRGDDIRSRIIRVVDRNRRRSSWSYSYPHS